MGRLGGCNKVGVGTAEWGKAMESGTVPEMSKYTCHCMHRL